ncbi:FtsZ/tubulin family protein [Desulfosudis oleivorans]|nr:hypothetical protein [Desulfosudis oleivorans]
MNRPTIAIVGVGGAGLNMVNYLKRTGINDPDRAQYIAVNCDRESLSRCEADILLPIGVKSFDGPGAKGNVRLGRDCAIESRDTIMPALEAFQLVFIVAGLGGGTGTGAAIEIARMGRDLGAITVALVTLPFSFESKKRMQNAEKGLAVLGQFTDALIVLPNNRLRRLASLQLTIKELFDLSSEHIRQAISGFIPLLYQAEGL